MKSKVKRKILIIILQIIAIITCITVVFMNIETDFSTTKNLTKKAGSGITPMINLIGNYKKDNLELQIKIYLEENNISSDKIAIYINDLVNDEEYALNENKYFFSASIYKLPLAMIYYEKIKDGVYSLNDLFLYKNEYYEVGGPISEYYLPGDYLCLKDILYYLIMNSDNTAGHILFENLGGWLSFKELATKYGQVQDNDTYYSYNNVMTARYLNGVLKYLYDNRNCFGELIDFLTKATPDQYLSKGIQEIVAQKYGYYDTAINAAGIVFCNHPYSIVILTDLGENARDYLGEINAICLDYFLRKG